MKRSFVLGLIMLAALAACAPRGVDQAEYDRVASELAAAKQQAADLQSKLTAAQQQAADLRSKLVAAEQRATELQSTLSSSEDETARIAAWWQDFAAAYQDLDAEKLPLFYTEDCQYSDPEWAFGGRAAIGEMVSGMAKGGDRVEVKNVYGCSDWGALEATWYTTRGGKKRLVPYLGIYVLKDGLISQEHLQWDGLLLQ